MNIIEKLQDLFRQATIERSHYYVAGACRDAILEIERLRKEISDEREACAKIAEDACDGLDDESQEFFVAANIMSAIRARSKQST